MITKVRIALAGMAVVGLMTGCTHQLQVKNLAAYQNQTMIPLKKPVSIGITTSGHDLDTRRILSGVAFELAKYSAESVYPYSATGLRKVDVVANIDIKPSYRGSGANFFISWPGFLIFTPAWNGYVYKVGYVVNVTLTQGTGGEQLDSFTDSIQLDVRHAAINRTWVEGAGWFFWTAPALVGACFHVGYDDSVSPLVAGKVESPLGDRIAQAIINRINSSGKFSKIKRIDEGFYVASFSAPGVTTQ